MDREFVERNQIVERYLSGKLPARGAADFERFCRENPDLLDAIGLPERVNAGLRLMEAGGKPEPWEEKPLPFWQKPPVIVAVAAVAFASLVALLVIALQFSDRGDRIAALEKQVTERPLSPATVTRTVRVLPSRSGPDTRPTLSIGGGATQLADMKFDLSWSKFNTFRVTIDRRDQGRVGVVYNTIKDSNGHIRIALNSSALGPGTYELALEGLTWRGEPVPQAWATLQIEH